MLGLDETESWAAVRRARLDSIPKLRREVIEHLVKVGKWQGTTQLAQGVAHPSRTTLRALEDLVVHGIVTRYVEEQGRRKNCRAWTLAQPAYRIDAGMVAAMTPAERFAERRKRRHQPLGEPPPRR
jgi:hypothetical protein